MGYNAVIVCVTVINLTKAFFFIGLDWSRLTNLIARIFEKERSHCTKPSILWTVTVLWHFSFCVDCSIVFLSKACDAGRAANKWLMVNVQNVQEFSCQVLNRDVWSNSTVKLVVEEHFILWQVSKLLGLVLLLGCSVESLLLIYTKNLLLCYFIIVIIWLPIIIIR